MMKALRTVLVSFFLAGLGLAGLGAGPLSGQDLTSAEKQLRLDGLRTAYRAEVERAGFDAPRAEALRDEVIALEKQPVSEPAIPAVTGATEASTDEAAPTTDHLIAEMQDPPDYDPRGRGNPCGPYAIAAVLRSFGQEVAYEDVYSAVAPSHGIGSGPHEIKSYLLSQGRDAVDRNHGSLDDVAAAIDRGERIMMMVNVGDPPTFESTHWISVKGYRMVGGKRHWILVDSAFSYGGSFKPGGRYEDGIPEEEFARMWSKPIPEPAGTAAGYSNYYIAVSQNGPSAVTLARNAVYGANQGTSVEVLMSGLRDATRGFDNTFGSGRSVGQRVGGFFTMAAGGIFKVGLNIPGALASAAGNALQSGGRGLRSWGSDQWNNGGLLGKVAGAGATLLGAITSGAGWAVNALGGLGSAIAGVAGDLVGGAGRLLGSALDGAGRLLGL